MSSASSVNLAVEKIITRDGAIRKDMARGLINIRALARYIQKETGVDASIEAIVSAIRRLSSTRGVAETGHVGRFIKKLSMRNKIIDLALVNHPDIHRYVWNLASSMDFVGGEIFNVVAGVQTIRVIMDDIKRDKISSFPQDKVIDVTDNLAEIIISLPPEAEKTPGVVAGITTELAVNGINMIEIMSCVPEIIIVVEEKDALTSYELIEKLSKEAEKQT